MTLLLYNKDCVKFLVTVTRLIEITIEFQFHYFVLVLIIVDIFHHASIMPSVRKRDFIIIGLKFIRITGFKLNKKTLISS